MPQGSQPVNSQSSTQCSTASCYESTLVTTGSDQYQILANPFEYFIRGNDLRVNMGTEEGLTLAEADTNGSLTNKLWSYNGSSYDLLQNNIILPWTGIWVKTLPSSPVNPAPTLLFPTSNAGVSVPVTRGKLIFMIKKGADVTQANTSNITNMRRGMFIRATSFNQDISTRPKVF